MEKELKQEFTFTREEIIKRNQDIADLINDYVNLYKERNRCYCPCSNNYINTDINSNNCNDDYDCDECIKKFYKQLKENMREKLLIRIDID